MEEPKDLSLFPPPVDLELDPEYTAARDAAAGKPLAEFRSHGTTTGSSADLPPAVLRALDSVQSLEVGGRVGGTPLKSLGAGFEDPAVPHEHLVTPEQAVVSLLSFIGDNPTRPGLQETPARVASAWQEWTSGYDIEPSDLLKCFQDGAEGSDEMVLITGIPVYSHCEHHMAAIFGEADVAYIPNGKIVGLSKIPRVVNAFARRLQVQERLTNQIATCLNDHLEPRGVAVRLRCRHMCMESRGINRTGTMTHTSALRGVFLTDPSARAEFFSMVARGG